MPTSNKPEVDVVAMPSIRSDGKPDQTANYKVLDDEGNAVAASKYDDPRTFTQQTPDFEGALPAQTATSSGQRSEG